MILKKRYIQIIKTARKIKYKQGNFINIEDDLLY